MWRNAMATRVVGLCGALLLWGVTVSQATTVTIQTDSDTTVWSNGVNNNFGTWQSGGVGRNLAKTARYRSLLHYDLATLPSNAIISTATLRLFIEQPTSDPLNLGLTAWRLQSSFVEGNGSTGVTWNTQPDVVASPTNTGTMNTSAAAWFEMNLQALTVEARGSAAPNDLYLRIAATDENPASGTAYFTFRTKEHGTGTQRAELVIDYVLPSPTPTFTPVPPPTSTFTAPPTNTPTSTYTFTPTPEGLPPDPSSVAPTVNLTTATALFNAIDFLYASPDPIQTGVPGNHRSSHSKCVAGASHGSFWSADFRCCD